MSIIKKNILKNGIGINIGDNVINFLFEKDTPIPSENQLQYNIQFSIEKQHSLQFYYGNNKTIENNKCFFTIILPTNKIITIKGKLLLNYIVISIVCKNIIIKNYIFNTCGDSIPYIEFTEDIERLRILHELKLVTTSVILKINNINLPNEIKNSIKNKIINLKNNIKSFENQQLQNKINILKNKFLL